ncbi:thioredoxin domain-containing protein [Ekhidna sp.]|uniref:thioredoxin domain-containing protein n=1 Tax=Ekhidna sp. TaxID=2608089 RepID=UPI003B5119C7
MRFQIILIIILSVACQSQSQTEMHEYTNNLIHSTSPYLQQHAHNPVNWQEWNQESLDQAIKEDKPILVSIGYSSCHWCHVMEKESFEDTAVANIMNEYFINIKVDREERPDVDQVYMDAVHAMGLQGGWPLNVFLTPDQKPFYGGTYFPKQGWINLLNSINQAFENNRDKINESADAFTQNLQAKESEKYKLEGDDHTLSKEEIDTVFKVLEKKFDRIDGGVKKSPKFPMPSVWQFLATYYHRTKNEDALKHLEFTLEKIADGGIFDHIGGGFARYSTDEEWHVPHFEKMLYDNGQLLSLYANGYKLTKNQKFERTILETTEWLAREMLDNSGGFYSALDADSEGEEGKFYVWTYEEIQSLAEGDSDMIIEYYDVQPGGNWEGKNALRVVKGEEKLAKKYNMSKDEFLKRVKAFKQKALTERERRVRPGLDDKIIAGWNGLTLSGLSDAYQALQDSSILELANKNAFFIKSLIKDGKLLRFPNKDMEGFMEDYAAVIQGFIKYYETTLDQKYLELAKILIERTEEAFFDESENLYFFSSNNEANLIARKKELFDNVIPSSNSIMAWNLVHLGTHLYDDRLIEKGKSMLGQVKNLMIAEPEYMSNWGQLAMEVSGRFAEVIIIGPKASEFVNKINQSFIPSKIVSGSHTESSHPPFNHKKSLQDGTTIYVCYNKSCKQPTNLLEEAIKELKSLN